MREGYRPESHPEDCPPSVLVLTQHDATRTADEVMRTALSLGAVTKDEDPSVRNNNLIYWIVYETNPGRVRPQTEWALRQAQRIRESQATA